MGVRTPILQRGNLISRYVKGVRTLTPSERKPYTLYVKDVKLPIPFQEAEHFSYTIYFWL